MIFHMTMLFAFDVETDYYIKQHKTEKYMGSLEETLTKPLLLDLKDADTYKIVNIDKSAHEKIIYVNNKARDVLDIANSLYRLIYFPFHGQGNQRFVLEPVSIEEETYFIKNGDKCIEYNDAQSFFEKKNCDSTNKNQIFELIPKKKMLENKMDKLKNKTDNEKISNFNCGINPVGENHGSKKFGEAASILNKLDGFLKNEFEGSNKSGSFDKSSDLKNDEKNSVLTKLKDMAKKMETPKTCS